MNNSEEKTSSPPQRVHRNIAFAPHTLNQYEGDSWITKKIIYYLQDRFDRDLFDFISLDPHVMSKATGIDRADLARIHPDPYQKRIKKLSQAEIEDLRSRNEYFETEFENALYRIMHQRIEFTVIDDTNPNNIEKTTKLFDFFDEVKILVDRKNRDKKVYSIKPSLFFAKNLKQYTLINSKNYFALSKGKKIQTGDLYVYLNYVKQTLIYKKESCFHAHKNLLAKVLCLPQYSRERKKIEVITKHLNEIQAYDPKLGLRYEWKSNLESPQFKDWVLLSFSNLESTREFLLDSGRREERTIEYFDHHLYWRLTMAFKSHYPALVASDFHFREVFSEWLTSNKDLNLKHKAYQDSYTDLFNETCADKYTLYYFEKYKHLSGEFAKRTF